MEETKYCSKAIREDAGKDSIEDHEKNAVSIRVFNSSVFIELYLSAHPMDLFLLPS